MRAALSIMLCPAGTVSTASSRLRCFGLGRELQRLGCKVQMGFDPAVLPDVLYVQKVSTPAIIDHAKLVRERGGQVVFDIDDWGDALPWVKAQPELLARLLAQCSLVTVDTQVRADVFTEDPAYRQVPAIWVLPDPVDYVDDVLSVVAEPIDTQALSGCWFGNGPNLAPALPYLQSALSTGRVSRFKVITNAQFVDSMRQAWPMLQIEAWQLDSFAASLRASDFCLLIHDNNLEGIQKSNNKMLAALAQGVVPLVSDTPAYAELAALIGIPELVCKTPEDLPSRLDQTRLAALRERMQSAQCRQVLDSFMPATVARHFLERIAALMPEAGPHTGPAAVAPIRLNLGCGDMLLPGYVNVDVATQRRGHQPDVCCDIRDLSAFADNHADEVMAIHVIEHFYHWEVVDLLKEWVRVLKPGGQLVLECPNLISACEALLKDPEVASRPGTEGNRSMWCFYGDPSWKDPLMCHRWLYTPQSLAQVMHEAGLRELSQQVPLFKARHPRDMRVVGVKPAPAFG